jgi:hypothetical protein
MAKFADQLFTDLMADYRPTLDETELPQPPKKRSAKPVWLTGGFATVVALITTASLLLTTGAPAYAVTRNSDGTVTVTLNQMAALQQAAAALHAMEANPTAVCELDSHSVVFPPYATNSVVVNERMPRTGAEGTVVVAATGPNGPPKVAWVLVAAPATHSCAALKAALDAARKARSNGPPIIISNGELVPTPIVPGSRTSPPSLAAGGGK